MSMMGLSRAEAVALVQRIMNADSDSEAEVDGWLEKLDRAFVCPTGYVSDLIFWLPVQDLSADEVIDKALAYRPIAL
ncbi:e9imm peptide [Streptomyces sp. NPDC059070]|uniref:e9imm peptide n=1 Tax=Streptomyces sp. NPDC059070 TaxID=3346713 RepID=UPI003694B5C3